MRSFGRVDENGRLTIPDFAGNLHYNTLGNFTENPRAGLIFTDFETGDVLQITGDTEIVFEGQRTRGTRPTWLIHSAKSRELRPFHDEIAELTAKSGGTVKLVAVHSEPNRQEAQGQDYSGHGRRSWPLPALW
ncbi:MAG: pyridoxamine 5'-phosphate oxidase family protein [Erythrobacter sp.]|nr:pyridoxamine 5'-phosphate oxidase family protein [Erythrobacter sp.]